MTACAAPASTSTPKRRWPRAATCSGRSSAACSAKSGDLLGPIERGVFAPADLRGTLASLCRGQVVGRRSDAERSVFKSVGTALEDLAAAVLAHGPGSTS